MSAKKLRRELLLTPKADEMLDTLADDEGTTRNGVVEGMIRAKMRALAKRIRDETPKPPKPEPPPARPAVFM
jgi:hypothetical protein